MSIYSDKLTHVQVVINCLYSIEQFFTGKDMLIHISGVPSIDDIMSYNLLTTTAILVWRKEGGRSNLCDIIYGFLYLNVLYLLFAMCLCVKYVGKIGTPDIIKLTSKRKQQPYFLQTYYTLLFEGFRMAMVAKQSKSLS